MKRSPQSGFTLVEIAIVMVIIGLLLGGALKGQQMIENARYKSWKSEMNALRAAVYSFQDIYGYLPGDIPAAKLAVLLPDASPATANTQGNGRVEPGWCSGTATESCFVFHHLRQAGLFAGDPALIGEASQFPTPVGGHYDAIASGLWGDGKMGLKILTREVPAEVAQRLDTELDDGEGKTGDISCYNNCDWTPGALQSVFIVL